LEITMAENTEPTRDEADVVAHSDEDTPWCVINTGTTKADEPEVLAHSEEETPWCVINTGTTKVDEETPEVVAHTADEDTPWCIINTGTSN